MFFSSSRRRWRPRSASVWSVARWWHRSRKNRWGPRVRLCGRGQWVTIHSMARSASRRAHLPHFCPPDAQQVPSERRAASVWVAPDERSSASLCVGGCVGCRYGEIRLTRPIRLLHLVVRILNLWPSDEPARVCVCGTDRLGTSRGDMGLEPLSSVCDAVHGELGRMCPPLSPRPRFDWHSVLCVCM